MADIQWWLVVAGGAPSLESVRVSVSAARDWARGSGGHTRVTIASTCTDNRYQLPATTTIAECHQRGLAVTHPPLEQCLGLYPAAGCILSPLELEKKVREVSKCLEKDPTSAFS